MAKRGKAQMSKTCTILPSVGRFPFVVVVPSSLRIAKKEDDPEQALKEFKTIVDKEEEKGDWYIIFFPHHPRMINYTGPGDLKRSNSRQNYCSSFSNDQTRPLRHIVGC